MAGFNIFVSLLILSSFASVFANNGRVVGGSVAQKKYRRHLAHIFQSGFSLCTASIIGRKWILSAAHCFDSLDSDISAFYVYVGVKNTDPGRNTKKYFVTSYQLHKRYDVRDIVLKYDVALLELEEDIEENKYYPVKLSGPPSENDMVVAAGYGLTEESGNSPRYAMQADLVYKSFKLCKSYEIDGYRQRLRKRVHVCAVSTGFPNEGNTDTCQGDSGGPLFKIKRNGKIKQFGITSFGTQGCARAGAVAWYARVKAFKNAIKDVVRYGSSADFDIYR